MTLQDMQTNISRWINIRKEQDSFTLDCWEQWTMVPQLL